MWSETDLAWTNINRFLLLNLSFGSDVCSKQSHIPEIKKSSADNGAKLKTSTFFGTFSSRKSLFIQSCAFFFFMTVHSPDKYLTFFYILPVWCCKMWGLVLNPLHVCRYTHVKGIRLKLGDNGYRRKLILCVCSSMNDARRVEMGFFALFSSPFLSSIIPHFIPLSPLCPSLLSCIHFSLLRTPHPHIHCPYILSCWTPPPSQPLW